ncbi:Paf1 complex component [Modicella reniformis]|uniref:Paf1 complex component n=1 Tax=Modicella reniformis TaxID=1440133 RepID=A0A9P6J2W3_9FUNG|nr:Paf1 complex component [Modicella reniformis]
MSDSEHTPMPEEDPTQGLFGSDDEDDDDDDDDDDVQNQRNQSQSQDRQSPDSGRNHDSDSDESGRDSPDRRQRRRHNRFSDDEDEEDGEQDSSHHTGGKVRRSAGRIDEDDDEDEEDRDPRSDNEPSGSQRQDLGDLFGDEDESGTEDDRRDHGRDRLPRLIIIRKRTLIEREEKKGNSGNETGNFLSRLPNFLNVDTKPFDPEAYNDDEHNGDEAENMQRIKLKVENTIRWRFKDGQDDPSIPAIEREKESNARFVRWSDGSLSLVLGDEMFQVNVQSLQNQHQFLVVHHPSELVLQTQQALTANMTFQPQSTQSLTHRKLTAAIAGKHVKGVKTVMVATLSDPKAAKEAIEQRELEQVRSRRKVAAERSRHARVTGLTASGLEESDGEHDEEDDEDFEAEEERRREKIMSIKKSGSDKYKSRNRYSSDEDSVDDDYDRRGRNRRDRSRDRSRSEERHRRRSPSRSRSRTRTRSRTRSRSRSRSRTPVRRHGDGGRGRGRSYSRSPSRSPSRSRSRSPASPRHKRRSGNERDRNVDAEEDVRGGRRRGSDDEVREDEDEEQAIQRRPKKRRTALDSDEE